MSVSALSGAAQVVPDGTLSGRRASSSHSSSQTLVTSADPRGGQPPLYAPVVHAYSFPSQMASDGRYIYQNSQEAQPGAYPYPHYPPPPPSTYDSSQQQQQQQQYASNPPPARPVRNNSSQSHSPHQPPAPPPAGYSQPPSGYPNPPPAYPAGQQFGVAQPPPNQQQWPPPPPENWSHYPQTFTQPNPPIQQEQQSFSNQGNGRAEQPPAPPSEHRVPSGSTTKPKQDARRDDRAHRTAGDPAPPPKGRKTREPEPPAPPPLPAPLGLDFMKLLDSYRLIIDSANVMGNDSSQPRPETLERMLQAASYGAQALDAAAKRVASDVPPETREQEADVADSAAKVPQKAESHPTEGQTCLGCNATSTPEWRRGPMGPRTLCNACGLVYAKLIKKRTREPGRGRGGGSSGKNPKRNGSGQASSDSDDDGSLDSQDRRSDVGDQGGRE
ncbi:hypothetical protein BXZ70DRAFT_1005619 [Cristinia sonorae]|uniref:GATA-type domain-containing protein n=1 Tax=Cristinia sonorae TaxID=1940300 RepID=A0A8K0UV57_9AGAR|nr:hypothetical protein BXZ70DRAFT_1005619 [Cristinia sonorae]